MAIDPNLLVIKPVGELETVANPTTGQILYYDGGNNLKKVSVEYFFQLLTGIVVPIDISDDEPTDQGWYKPTTSGTYTNAGGLVAEDGYDTYFYYDGVDWIKTSVRIPTAKIPTWTSETYISGSQVISPTDYFIYEASENVISTDVPGISNKWKRKVGGYEKIVLNTYGSTQKTSYYTNLDSVYYLGNSYKSDGDSFITNISFDIQSAGTVSIALGSANSSNIFQERKTISFTATSGLNSFDINEALFDQELVLLKTPLPLVGYKTSGTKAIFTNSSGGTLQSAAGLDISMSFKTKKTVNTLDEYLFNPQNVEEIGSISKSQYYLSSDLASIQYIGTNFYWESEKIILEMKIDLGLAGTLNLAIGSIDQAGKFIERKVLHYPAIQGINVIKINEKLQPLERILLKSPHLNHGVNISGTTESQIYFLNNGGTIQYNAFTAAYTLTVGDNAKVDTGQQDSINELYTKVAELSVKTETVYVSPNGNKYKIAVDNSGNLFTKPLVFDKILHLGNSLSLHSIQSYWWGQWGMAASEQSKDYVHRFLTKIQTKFPSAQTWVQNIALFEQQLGSYNKSLIDLSMNPNLICVRLGENVNNISSFPAAFDSLISYLITNAPQATIFIGGVFWANADKDTAMSQVASNKGLTFVPLSDLDLPENKSFIGAQVKGDDGLWHTVDNAGVANHPGDLGMDRIATRLFNSLGL